MMREGRLAVWLMPALSGGDISDDRARAFSAQVAAGRYALSIRQVGARAGPRTLAYVCATGPRYGDFSAERADGAAFSEDAALYAVSR